MCCRILLILHYTNVLVRCGDGRDPFKRCVFAQVVQTLRMCCPFQTHGFSDEFRPMQTAKVAVCVFVALADSVGGLVRPLAALVWSESLGWDVRGLPDARNTHPKCRQNRPNLDDFCNVL